MTDPNRARSGAGLAALRWSLRWKIVGLTVVSMAVLAAVLAWAFGVQARTVMLEDLRAQARTMAQSLAKNLAYNLSTSDIVALQTAVDGLVQDAPDLAYVVVRDPGGGVLADAKSAAIPDVPGGKLVQPVATSPAGERPIALGRIPGHEVSLPITQWYGSGKPLGSIQLAVRLDRVTDQITAVVRGALGVAVLVLLAASAAATFMAAPRLRGGANPAVSEPLLSVRPGRVCAGRHDA